MANPNSRGLNEENINIQIGKYFNAPRWTSFMYPSELYVSYQTDFILYNKLRSLLAITNGP